MAHAAAIFPGFRGSESMVRCLSREDTFKFKDADLPSELVAGLGQQRNQGRFLDLTVLAGGVKLRAHRIVLSAAVPYFQAMFNYEQDSDTVELPGLNGECVGSLLDYVYSGRLDIHGKNVQDLLIAANFLQMKAVCQACCRFIVRNIDGECCTDVWLLGDQLGQPQLMEEAEKYITSHLLEVLESSDHNSSLPLSLLEIALAREDLVLADDDSILIPPGAHEAKLALLLIKYLSVNSRNKLYDHLKSLLHLVRLPLLTSEELDSVNSALKNMHMNDCEGPSKACQHLVKQARNTEAWSAGCPVSSTVWCRPRFFQGLHYQSSITSYYADGFIPAMRTFDDQQYGRQIRGMTVWIRKWDGRNVVGGMHVFYQDCITIHGGDSWQEKHEFHLHDDEFITKLEIRAGWLVDSVCFLTNKGVRYGPWGGNGGSRYVEPTQPIPMGSFLGYMSGAEILSSSSSNMGRNKVTGPEYLAVTELRFTWGVYKYNQQPAGKSKNSPTSD